MTFRDIYDMIDALAPFSTQMDFDNSGLLAGHPDREITGIHVALDVTHRVLEGYHRVGLRGIAAVPDDPRPHRIDRRPHQSGPGLRRHQ